MSRAARLIAELERRQRAASFSAERLCGPNVEQLRAVISKAKRKVLRCGRRAGKTTAVAIALLMCGLEEPVVPLLYVTLTRENAKEILWNELCSINKEYGLGGVEHLSRLTMTMPNGCEIQLRGAHTPREIAKYRGKKFKMAVIDEAQSFPDRVLVPLIKDVIGPTLLDYGGDLWLVGTPVPLKRGYFYENYAGKMAAEREQHRWTIRENFKLPARMAGRDIEEILADVRKEYGWTEDDPTYRREYLGEDVEDPDALLYQFAAERNTYQELPTGAWTYVFGIDIGHDDSDAIAVLGWVANTPTVYLVDEFVRDKQDITDLANKLHELLPIYKPVSMSIDQGGLGKKIAEELRRRRQLSVVPADKAQKGGYIKLLNADLRKGKILARPGSRFGEDCGVVRKDPEAWARGELKELDASKGGFHSDICDAVLYGWRACRAYFETPPKTEKDRMSEQHRKMAEAMDRNKNVPWWEKNAGKLGFG